MADGTTSTLTETLRGGGQPETARRTWPRWLLLGVGMVAVAVVALGWSAAGSRLLVGALGVFLCIRGAVLVRRAATLDAELRARAPRLGAAAVGAGIAALVVAGTSAVVSGAVLLVVVPLALLAAAAALVVAGWRRAAGRSGAARLGGAGGGTARGHRVRAELDAGRRPRRRRRRPGRGRARRPRAGGGVAAAPRGRAAGAAAGRLCRVRVQRRRLRRPGLTEAVRQRQPRGNLPVTEPSSPSFVFTEHERRGRS